VRVRRTDGEIIKISVLIQFCNARSTSVAVLADPPIMD
jgi:hypothetical protein